MEVVGLAEGLWRWTTAHPDWRPGADWDAIVGCVYHETPDAVVLVDPLVPGDADEAARFWEALDRDVGRLGLPVVALTTCHWHERSVPEIVARYDGRVADPQSLPTGVTAIPAPTADEVVYWLSGPRAAVPGDTLLGDGAGGITVCTAGWIDSGGSVADLVAELAPLLELPVEMVLVSHGEPVLSGGAEALRRALGRSA